MKVLVCYSSGTETEGLCGGIEASWQGPFLVPLKEIRVWLAHFRGKHRYILRPQKRSDRRRLVRDQKRHPRKQQAADRLARMETLLREKGAREEQLLSIR